MHANTFGKALAITSFGESRGKAIGVVIDGCPSGIEISKEDFELALKERKSQYFFETPRSETDKIEILSGIFEGRTLGSPIAIIVENQLQGSKNYEVLKDVFRPGHADATWQAKFGFKDFRGGGRSSGRETVARVLAATIANKILEKNSIQCEALPSSVAGLDCKSDGSFTKEIFTKLQEAKTAGNSYGGIVICKIQGVPAGLGEPVFCKLDAELAKAIMSIGAVKGISFGAGFELATMDGKSANDLEKNYNGGILGGISTGELIYFTVAVKPVPSISLEQKAINISGEKISLKIKGQHDNCIVRRICPVIKAMSELVIADFLLLARLNQI